MADTIENIEKVQKLHSMRCCNPLGKEGHGGKNLRKISKSILKVYPSLHPRSKICHICRETFYKTQKDHSLESDVSLESNVSVESNVMEDLMEFDDSSEELPSKQICKSREEQLEKLLNGLKEKFLNLPNNNPLRKSILTIAPDCWSIRKISEEFQCSYRMAKQSKELKNSSGVLSVSPFKKGKNVDQETVSKVIEFYENDTISPASCPTKKKLLL